MEVPFESLLDSHSGFYVAVTIWLSKPQFPTIK